MKKYKLIILLLVITIILTIGIFYVSINKSHTSDREDASNISAKAIYYLDGQGDTWEFYDGVLISDSERCFFANGQLRNNSNDEIVLISKNISMEVRNKNNEVVSYLLGSVGPCKIIDGNGRVISSGQENIEPYRSIQVFDRLDTKQEAIYYKDIENNDLYLILEYTDENNVINKEEIKLNKKLFTWN
ncbi:hypothetical protein ACPWSR_12565 [Alloiococcus sp. CFN-8]|uniref:hypothetical protein n=1 Tax=Alloiococcus sp. CFN-8 TaxID=3416081 RepID=UPI003CFA9A55